MKTLRKTVTLLTLLIACGVTAQTKKDKKIIVDAIEAKAGLLEVNPKLKRFFNKSAGYVIFPNVGKGGFIIGAASGNGVLYEDGDAVGMTDLKKLNVGFQAGGQAIIEVIFFDNHDDLKRFKEGNFAFSGEASAVVLKSGIAANAKYRDRTAVFTLPKAGLMADASVGGQKFAYHPF